MCHFAVRTCAADCWGVWSTPAAVCGAGCSVQGHPCPPIGYRQAVEDCLLRRHCAWRSLVPDRSHFQWTAWSNCCKPHLHQSDQHLEWREKNCDKMSPNCWEGCSTKRMDFTGKVCGWKGLSIWGQGGEVVGKESWRESEREGGGRGGVREREKVLCQQLFLHFLLLLVNSLNYRKVVHKSRGLCAIFQLLGAALFEGGFIWGRLMCKILRNP